MNDTIGGDVRLSVFITRAEAEAAGVGRCKAMVDAKFAALHAKLDTLQRSIEHAGVVEGFWAIAENTTPPTKAATGVSVGVEKR